MDCGRLRQIFNLRANKETFENKVMISSRHCYSNCIIYLPCNTTFNYYNLTL